MITLGFSPCPNDTFIFYAITNKKIDTKSLDFNFLIEDVETLNHLAMKRMVDITKISCHAFYFLQDDYWFLRSGGAFGRGCGPLLVQKSEVRSQKSEIKKIAIPGELTTAFLLLKLYLASTPSPITHHPSPSFIAMPFYEIMRAVRDEKVDAGLIIHESRFTYPEYGLIQVVDLGQWWENETCLPIPLGGIIAKKSLGDDIINEVEHIIKESIKYSCSNREEALQFIKNYSQELSEDVILKHISLYVNDYSLDIGKEGADAFTELLKRAKEVYI
jgi:1,4-dihydroxy-6-naphthoate synthase